MMLRARPITTEPDATVLADGSWTWFSVRRGIMVGGDFYAGGVSSDGSIVVGKAGSAAVTLKATLQVDDHNNPSLLRRSSDGRIIAHYCAHNAVSTYFQRISTNPDDLSSWGDETNLDSSFGLEDYSYANLIEIEDGIFAFYRADNGVYSYSLHYSVSTDNGATWSAGTRILTGGRPYWRAIKTGANRIDFCCNDGHPNEIGTNSTYHFYYDAGTWRVSNGDPVGVSLPFTPSSHLTRIYNGATIPSWVWDIAWDSVAGAPVVVFATFPNAATDHRYNYARWTGSAWSVSQVCTAGARLYAAETYYSGGICIDPDNVDVVYASREIGGTWNIWKGVTPDDGATWFLGQVINQTGEKAIRPNKESGSPLSFMLGDYTTYENYDTRIVEMAV